MNSIVAIDAGLQVKADKIMKQETLTTEQGRIMKKLLLLLFVAITLTGGVSAQAEFIDNAFQRAATPPAAGGWVVMAKVAIKAPGKEYISAYGQVTLQSDGSLAGDLPMSLDKKEIAHNTLRFSIRKNNPAIVTITRMIAGKPFLGRSAEIFLLPVNPNVNYLTWTFGSREITVHLETEPARPIGARYKITGRVVFTNTEDGVLDNTCEVSGGVALRRVSYGSGSGVVTSTWLFEIIPQDVTAVATFPFTKVIDVYDEDKSQFSLDGRFYDRDHGPTLGIETGAHDDMMWPDPEFPRRINLKKEGESVFPGDRDSENAEVYITVTKISDLYKREPTKTVWLQ